MKRIFYVLIVFLLGAVACSKKELTASPEEGKATITIDMMVSFPQTLQATKGETEMADAPKIDNIYVAVFGSKHALNEYTRAIPVDAAGNVLPNYASENGTQYRVRVTLLASTGQRYVHIIANGPPQLDYLSYEDLMLAQVTSGTDSGYWQWFALDHGTAKLDGADWVPSDEAAEKFGDVNLIRNFARIKVTSSAANFTFNGFHVYQTPKSGSYAMPTDDSGKAYVNTLDYKDVGLPSVKDKIDYIKSTLKYPGYMPALPEGQSLQETPKAGDDWYKNAFQYVYESPNIDSDQDCPFIIIRGQYGDDEKDTYYKIELMDEFGHRIPIYRNLDYTINLKAVGKRGEDNPANAVTSNANVSTEAVELSEISDGISGLYVMYTEKAFVVPAAAGQTVTFQYKYEPDLNDSEVEGTRTLTLEDGGTAIDVPTTGNWYTESGPDSDGWYTISFKINQSPATGAANLESKFTVMGTNSGTDGHLYREVKVIVIPKPEFTNVSLTQAGTTVNSDVTLKFTLPDLPDSAFPLTFQISDSGKCLNPRGNDMPVESKDGSFYFVKTISLTEYKLSKEVTCNLKRIAQGRTKVTIVNANKYFDSKDTNEIQ